MCCKTLQQFKVHYLCCCGCHQLSSVQKENLRLRGDLERELGSCQTLQLQLDSKDQLIASLRAQLDSRAMGARLSALDASGARTPAKEAAAMVRDDYLCVQAWLPLS